MSFVIRAALVISALSWLALQRQEPATPARSTLPQGPTESALLAWEALPDATREAALREGAVELARRAGAIAAAPSPSRDTLMDGDRTLPWRGARDRPDHGRAAF